MEEIQQEFQPALPEIDTKADTCTRCGKVWEVGDYPTCKGNQKDHETRPKGMFPAFDYEGVRITNLEQLRNIERRAAKEGTPINWRAFSLNNDGKHYDAPVFGKNPDQEPHKRASDHLGKDGRPHADWMPAPSSREYDSDD